MSFVAEAQIINIPDANFKAKLLAANIGNSTAQNYLGNPMKIDVNNDGEIQISEAQNVYKLFLTSSYIYDLTGISNFINLTQLSCNNNQLSFLDLNSCTNIIRLKCDGNQLTNLNINSLNNLQHLDFSGNLISNFDFSIFPNLQTLYCSSNNLNNISLNNNINLTNLTCSYNQLTSLNLINNSNIINLYCDHNQLNSINLIPNSNLYTIECNNNNITSLNLSNMNSLVSINCSYNQINNLNLLNCNSVNSLMCYYNSLINLDLEDCLFIQYLGCSSNLLEFINLKNGLPAITFLEMYNNSTLKHFCCDEEEIDTFQNLVTNLGYINCNVNSYCSFVPGGVNYEVDGVSRIDSNSNGCDVNDINYSNLNLSLTNGTNSGTFISNYSGNYSIPVQSGSHTITPVLENPTYFNINPTSFVANFPTQTSPLIQDFCVTPNGVHHDVEVAFIPTNPARPGFDANYTIIYKNKGNQVENGTVTLDFNGDFIELVSFNPSFSLLIPNSISWNYTNLQPFETRTIDVVFNVNSPMETPAVNIGDQLNYVATITPLTTDEFQYDNTSALKQIVVGSYDPNDKTCVEGTTVGPDMIGQYVHYVIRFENTGTFAAENVVVKDMIDLTKFDIATLIPLYSSHDFVTRIAGNKVEFIFEGINLPFDDATNDGYIAFKIKTKSNLVVGDTFSNEANIYFDYNFPIITNTFTTTIAALKVTDFDFGTHFTLYPNPVKDVLNFQSKNNVTINSIEIYNTLGQVVLAVPNAVSTVDVSSLQSGNYFVKVNTDLGVSNTKFIKE